MLNQTTIKRACVAGLLGAFGLAGTAPAIQQASAQDRTLVQGGAMAGFGESSGIGTRKDEAGERILDQMLPAEVGTPSQDERLAPAAGDLGDGVDADLTGPLGRSSEAPLGRAGSAGGGGAVVGQSFGGGGVRVDGETSGGGGVDIDRRSGGDLSPGLSGSSSGAGGSLGN
ncbi:MAG TPA: hypothetical protein VFZ01_09890 [Geminicoccaceae bacterium]